MGCECICQCRGQGLIEEMDPAEHYFHPLELHLKSGEVLRDSYFLLRMGGLLEGIVPEESQVGEHYIDGKFIGYQRSAVRPKITWRSSAIEGRHFWMDKHFKHNIYCSDAFMAELKRRNIGHFRPIPSFIAN